jgi:putative membrane protein
MRTSLLTLVVLTVLALPPAPVGAQAPNPDAAFMREAFQGGLAEVEIGRLAADRAASLEVKQFGQRMVMDHGAANGELARLATEKGVTLPAEPGPTHVATRDRLAALRGTEFDRQYMAEMVRDHQEDVAAFQREADTGQDPDVRAWAAKTLPVLRDHLSLAQTVHGQVALVQASPATTVVTTPEAPPWCGGAYRPAAGTNFGICPSR